MNALDRIDYEIVRLLRKNARISNKELAGLVGLAPSTCLVRTRLLQQAGVITGFKAEVNPAKLGVGLQAMISVRLKRHYKPDVEAFRGRSDRLPGARMDAGFGASAAAGHDGLYLARGGVAHRDRADLRACELPGDSGVCRELVKTFARKRAPTGLLLE